MFIKEYRCSNCNRLLFKGDLIDGNIEVKCGRCKHIELYTAGSVNIDDVKILDV